MDICKRYNITKEEYAAYMIPDDLYEDIGFVCKKSIEGIRVFCFGCGTVANEFCENAKQYKFCKENIFFVDNNSSKVGKFVWIGDERFVVLSKKQMLCHIGQEDMIVITTGLNQIHSILEELEQEKKLEGIELRILKKIPVYNAKERTKLKVAKMGESKIGYCVICEEQVLFRQYGKLPRYDYLCVKCMSEVRNRAIVNAMNLHIPNWKNKIIHEASAAGATLKFFMNKCEGYTYSEYFENCKSGEYVLNHGNLELCQNLESLSYGDETIDVFVTQDVFEHVLDPQKAFAEIGRVLKKGGVHIFTIPWYSEYRESRCRVRRNDKGVSEYLEKKMYHGSVNESQGSIVTYDYGQDLAQIIYKCSKMITMVYLHREEKLGLTGDFLEVVVSTKL